MALTDSTVRNAKPVDLRRLALHWAACPPNPSAKSQADELPTDRRYAALALLAPKSCAARR